MTETSTDLQAAEPAVDSDAGGEQSANGRADGLRGSVGSYLGGGQGLGGSTESDSDSGAAGGRDSVEPGSGRHRGSALHSGEGQGLGGSAESDSDSGAAGGRDLGDSDSGRCSALHPGDTVLVTGASGLVGRVVVPCLAEAGFRVIATGRHRFDSPAADRVVLGDPRDPQWVESAVCGTANGQPVDGIVHLAAIPSPGGHPDPEIFATNTQGAFTILDAAARLGVRVAAVASSFSAYGYPWAGRRWSPPYVPIDEAQPAIPIDSYGLSKTVVEQVCAYADRRWGLPVVAFRMPFVGRGDHLAAWLKRSAADPEAMAQELWAWIDTRDVGRAIIQALTVGLEGYHLLNIAAPDTTVEVPTRELIKRYHPTTQIIGEFPGCASVVDCHQARRVLGFEARYSWRDGSALVV